MLSKLLIRKFHKTIGFKIAAGYSVLVACSFFALIVFAYLLLEAALIRQDRQIVFNEVQALQAQYQAGGKPAFDETVDNNDRFRKNNPFFIRAIQNTSGDGLIYFPQYWEDFNLSALEEMPGQVPGQWIDLPNITDTYHLEILTARHSDGRLFQVGISTEDRLVILNRFKESFLAVSIPLILLAAGGGALLSRRTLSPLRSLILTVASIESGQMDARVRLTHTGDELGELGSLFNTMIEKINLLIQGMKGALDCVAHDLRTPITRFRNMAEAALQRERTPAAYREALEECIEESDRILRKLQMLMDISEAETGTMRLQHQLVDLVQLAGKVVEMYRYVGEEKNIQIETEFPGTAPLEADPDRICQVMANLLDNAVKFTAEGGRIRVAIKNEPGKVSFQVTDSGIGIEPADIPKIWDRLYRGKHASHKGLGLGLSLVEAVVHAHRGTVAVSSTPRSGSFFCVNLPACGPTPPIAT